MTTLFWIISWVLLVLSILFPMAGLFTVVYSIATKDSTEHILLCVLGMVLTFVAGGLFFVMGILLRFLAGHLGNNGFRINKLELG